jgi:hypothetical protein
MACSMSVPAFASGFYTSMNSIGTDPDSINIIYNGQLMTYTDAVPENINDRVMLPFRAVLESMGATVDYDEETRLVTAKKGDITITFTLEDNVIYIDNNGEKSQIELDVPMIIKNDRTLVPIRFISNALGMQVGWDGDYQTVMILDADSYVDEITENAPNLIAASEEIKSNKYNTEALNLSFDFNAVDTATEETTKISASFDLDSKTADDISSVSGTVSADLGANYSPVNDAALEAVLADGKLYFKTDFIEQLLADKSDVTSKLVAGTISGDRWFYVDLNELGLSTKITSLISALDAGNIIDVLKSALTTDGDVTMESAEEADMLVDTYLAIDKYITVTDNSVEIKLDKDDLSELLTFDGASELLNMIDFDLYALVELDENQANSKATMNFGLNDGNSEYSISFDLTDTAKNEEDVTPAEIPENAVDLISLLSLIQN